jgi:hypothetical protein
VGSPFNIFYTFRLFRVATLCPGQMTSKLALSFNKEPIINGNL